MAVHKSMSASPSEPKQYFVVMRHGRRLDEMTGSPLHETPWDTPLSPVAVSECKAKAHDPLLQSIEFGLVLISPFMRCQQTALHLLPSLRLRDDCDIHIHLGLSEVHSMDIIFGRGQRPTICSQWSFWNWRRRRSRVESQFRAMGGHTVSHKVLGSRSNT
jgi:broad specificity phosphatase PhoE